MWFRPPVEKTEETPLPSAAETAVEREARFRAQVLPALDSLYRLARVLTADRLQAEELAQETCMRALRYFDTYRGEQDIRAWLSAILRNVHRDRAGARRGEAAREAPLAEAEAIADPAPDPEAVAIAADRAAGLRAAVARLPEPLRDALLLREFSGLSYAAIATAQGVPIGTVMSRLARARAQLCELLTP